MTWQKRHPRREAGRQTAGRAFQSPLGHQPDKDAQHLARRYTESPDIPYSRLSYPKTTPKNRTLKKDRPGAHPFPVGHTRGFQRPGTPPPDIYDPRPRKGLEANQETPSTGGSDPPPRLPSRSQHGEGRAGSPTPAGGTHRPPIPSRRPRGPGRARPRRWEPRRGEGGVAPGTCSRRNPAGGE